MKQVLRRASRNDSQNKTKPTSEAATGDINIKRHLCSWSPRIKKQNQEDIAAILALNTQEACSLLASGNRHKRQEMASTSLPPSVS